MAKSNSETNFSWILHAPGDIKFENQGPPPKLKPNEVQIAVKATGICGSDVHYWVDGRIGHFVVNSPMVLGHESAGVVTATGSNVKRLKVGDQVAIEPGVPCYICEFCKSGRYNLCPEMKFAATPPINGTLCEYYNSPEDFCVKLPENFPGGVECGALIEPLSVGLQACKRANLTAGQTIMIFGAGPIGLLCGAAASVFGVVSITMVDISQSRLEFAKEYFAPKNISIKVIVAEKIGSEENSIDYSKRFSKKLLKSGIERTDVVFECSGAETSIQTGIYMTKNGGTLVQVGMGKDIASIPITEIGIREIKFLGTFRYCNTYQQAVDLAAAGLVDLQSLITHRFRFVDETLEAFQTVLDGKGGVVKALILAD